MYVIGYTGKGELLFNYGDYGSHVSPIINPRGLSVNEFGHVLVCDLLTSSVSPVT